MNLNLGIPLANKGFIDLCSGLLNGGFSGDFMSIKIKVSYRGIDHPTPIIDAPHEMLFASSRKATGSANITHLTIIQDKRLCIRSEPNLHNILNIEILKIITGGHSITACAAYYKEYETFSPIAFLILMSMPRRTTVVPFNNIYTNINDPTRPYNSNNPRHRLRDVLLKEKLDTVSAKERLFIWLVRGAVF
ncbi:hypothetical protein K502DRAFT_349888 [Neoconidiobolus thromboides FSU 785]|nr:hypothetical protein K502DRAFT_349888 [Neoconidiobolus thromboides FSU 785]